MKSFASPSQMLDVHEAMFADAGRRAAEDRARPGAPAVCSPARSA